MNIAYFLLPKSRIAYLYDDFTFRQGLEKMRNRGYTAIPVITRDGRYAGTVSEGDFLWKLLDTNDPSMKKAEELRVRDIIEMHRPGLYQLLSRGDKCRVGRAISRLYNQGMLPHLNRGKKKGSTNLYYC